MALFIPRRNSISLGRFNVVTSDRRPITFSIIIKLNQTRPWSSWRSMGRYTHSDRFSLQKCLVETCDSIEFPSDSFCVCKKSDDLGFPRQTVSINLAKPRFLPRESNASRRSLSSLIYSKRWYFPSRYRSPSINYEIDLNVYIFRFNHTARFTVARLRINEAVVPNGINRNAAYDPT